MVGRGRRPVFNQNTAEAGLPGCSDATTLPLLQDNSNGDVWATFGVVYNSYFVVDGKGILQARFLGETLPAVADELVSAVEEALAQ
jgi:hypothetical protein